MGLAYQECWTEYFQIVNPIKITWFNSIFVTNSWRVVFPRASHWRNRGVAADWRGIKWRRYPKNVRWLLRSIQYRHYYLYSTKMNLLCADIQTYLATFFVFTEPALDGKSRLERCTGSLILSERDDCWPELSPPLRRPSFRRDCGRPQGYRTCGPRSTRLTNSFRLHFVSSKSP